MPLSTKDWLFKETNAETKRINPNYLCVITCQDQNVQITANLPQDFQTSTRANYESSFSQLVSNNINSKFGDAAKAFGMQLTTKALSAQVWQGSTEFVFNLPLVFHAIDDEYNDVTAKLMDLHRLTLPDENAVGLLTSPGPRLNPRRVAEELASASIDAARAAQKAISSGVGQAIGRLKNSNQGSADNTSSDEKGSAPTSQRRPLISCVDNNISLAIGRYMYFESVVIEGIDVSHKVRPLASGDMGMAEVQVSFKTFYQPTKSDINTIFVNSTRNERPQSRR